MSLGAWQPRYAALKCLTFGNKLCDSLVIIAE
jgi:hypothetical protein